MKILKLLICLFVIVSCEVVFAQTDDLQAIRERAYNGDANAMLELAQYYRNNGKTELADMWLSKAEETKPGVSLFVRQDLAVEEELNEADRSQDSDESLYVYLKYADTNNVHALVRIGEYYDKRSNDKDEAIRYYSKAISVDSKKAFSYMNPDCAIAFSLMSQEASKGNADVALILGNYFYKDEDYVSDVQKWYKIAADKGNEEAKNKLNKITKIIAEQEREEQASKQRFQNFKNSVGVAYNSLSKGIITQGMSFTSLQNYYAYTHNWWGWEYRMIKLDMIKQVNNSYKYVVWFANPSSTYYIWVRNGKVIDVRR